MTLPDSGAVAFARALLGMAAHEYAAPRQRGRWWSEFWTALAGRTGSDSEMSGDVYPLPQQKIRSASEVVPEDAVTDLTRETGQVHGTLFDIANQFFSTVVVSEVQKAAANNYLLQLDLEHDAQSARLFKSVTAKGLTEDQRILIEQKMEEEKNAYKAMRYEASRAIEMIREIEEIQANLELLYRDRH